MSKDITKDGSVTIIVPTYNRSTYVKECLESILAQTYKAIRVLVVDDGSTDDTVSVVEAMCKLDKRVSLRTHGQNTGSMNAALAYGINVCTTEYVTWIGSDDTYTPNAIAQFVHQHKLHPNVDYVSCDLKMTSLDSDHCKYCNNSWPGWGGYASVDPLVQFDAKSYVKTVYHALCPPFPWNGMWKTEFFKRNGISWIEYKHNTWSPDTLNGLHFFAHGMKMLHYNEFPLIIYRLHETQDTVTGAVSEQIRCDITLIDAIFEWFDTDVFLGEKCDDSAKHTAYINRLKSLLTHHEARFQESDKLKLALSRIAVHALTYMWEHRMPKDEESKSFFEAYL